ncbi:MAG: ATP-binding cassette domain-containing protein [Streptosporangiales bacterium]|nr:ATP-binding cassette domain-containing protein [Streptosporangiales bacterium]
MSAGLSLVDASAGYFGHDLVLDGVRLHAPPGWVTAVLGPNGSGKSTALRVLYGFLRPREGRVVLDDRDITDTPVDERTGLGVAFLPQGRSVFPRLTVEENLRLGAWSLRRDRRRLNEAVDRMFDRYPLLVPLRAKPAGGLSGGQARLLEFGRTLVLDPRIVLVDEPSVGLSPALVDEVYEELGKLKDEGRAILLVDQNIKAAVGLADYVYTLAYGRNHLEGERQRFGDQLDQLIKEWLQL